MNAKTTIILAAFAAFSCSDKKETTEKTVLKTESGADLDDAKWLIGQWQDASEKGTLTETWTSESDSAYSAKTFFVTPKNDTVFAENVRLVNRNGNLVYIAQAYGQNDDKPVEFALVKNDAHEMVFENPKHDYPTRIVYEHTGDSLKAWISGMKSGVEAKEEFPMKRVK